MKQELERLLLQKEEFLVEGALNKNKLAELARQYDSMLKKASWFSKRILFCSSSIIRSSCLIALRHTRPRLGLRLAIIATCQKITKLSSISLIKTVY